MIGVTQSKAIPSPLKGRARVGVNPSTAQPLTESKMLRMDTPILKIL